MTLEQIGTHAFGPRLQIERYRLDNGLTLLFVPDSSAPVASYQTWFAVGSRHERKGKTGIAHLFEHLMFNETENIPYGEYDRRLEAVGADSNAATFLDWTYYLINLPSEALDLAVEMESERMHQLVLRDPQVESEREVVTNERRQTVDDDVDGKTTELLYSNAFTTHGYQWPTIGFMADIQGLTTSDCRAFYRTYYAPNNATVVVVGDVERARLLELVEARYSHIEAGVIPAEEERPEPEQTAERRVSTSLPTATHKLAIGYKSPAMSHSDHAPLVLLNEVLFAGRSSRAHRALVQRAELATDVGGYVGNFRDPSLYDIYLTAREGHDCEKLLAALDTVLDDVVASAPHEDELQRARARVELATLRGLETVSGKADQMGFCEVVLGDPAAMLARLDAYQAVTCADLDRVAKRYLQRCSRTVVEVAPEAS